MNRKQKVIVYIGEAEAADAFAAATGWRVFNATTFREGLSQVIFSYPDAVVVDATDDVLRAEDSYFHLRTIEHPPLLILSDVPGRWEVSGQYAVEVLAGNSDLSEQVAALRQLLGEVTEALG